MILSDTTIRTYGETLVWPFKPDNVQPASIDLTLDSLFLIPRYGHHEPIDLRTVSRDPIEYTRIATDGEHDSPYFTLLPRMFILGSTAETLVIPRDLVGRVEGKSSLGRLGLIVHSTAGFVDPGFEGKITLEFYNLNNRSIILRPGLRICQVSFTKLTCPAAKPYGHADLGSKYQGQTETTSSRYQG